MKVFQLAIEQVNALRSWFHPKDRSIILAPSTFIEGEEIVTPAHPAAPGNPPHNRGRLYWKNGYWTQLNESGVEQILTGPALISETALSANAASVTFSNIPQIFRHLELTCQVRTDLAAEADNVQLRFNGDSSASYDRERLSANNVTVSSAAARGGTADQIGICEAANSRANNFSPITTRIYGYSRSDCEKWTLSHSATFGDVSADTDLQIQQRGGRWRSTGPITSIILLPVTGANFVSGSRFQLYGLW